MGNTGLTARRWAITPRTHQDIAAQLLANRNIGDAERFFHPDYDRDSHDPHLLPGMAAALDRITRAIAEREAICVFGDYDADGIPGTAVLMKTLRANGATVRPYIPDREREGYGLNRTAIDTLAAEGIKLIITVDLGITGAPEVAQAARLGVDVIITDHHHVDPSRVPTDAVAVVHPALPGSEYPFKGLAGGGVSWKLCQALAAHTGTPTPGQLKWWLELPAISTVCDMVPLVDENRMIVHFGLKVLMQTRNAGLQAMYRAGGIANDALTERTIGYHIGPRINAPGRMDSAAVALDLLLADDPARAHDVAAAAEQHNRERQEQLDGVVKATCSRIEAEGLHERPAIVLAGDGWPAGVVGLAASRVVERFHRPAIILGIHDGVAKGSGRSIKGFNLLAGIDANKDLLLTHGGHEMAAGLQLRAEQVPAFAERFTAFAAERLTDEDFIPTKTADMLLEPAAITPELAATLAQFAPFGVGNPKPRFVVAPLTVAEVRQVGAAKQHLKLTFAGGLDGIAFGMGGRAQECAPGSELAVLGSVETNVWNGHERLQLLIDDLKPRSQFAAEQVG